MSGTSTTSYCYTEQAFLDGNGTWQTFCVGGGAARRARQRLVHRQRLAKLVALGQRPATISTTVSTATRPAAP